MTIDDDKISSFRAPTSAIAGYLRSSISLSDLAAEIWGGRWIVLAATIIGMLYGAYDVNSKGARYVAVVQVAPAETDAGGAFSGAPGASGLLSGLIGGSSAAVPNFAQFLNALNSVGVAEVLDKKYDMICQVYRGQCDLKTHTWKERTGLEPWFRGLLARIGRLPSPNGARTAIDLAAYDEGAVEKEESKTNSLVKLRYTHDNPKFAAYYLSLLVKTTNDYVRGQHRETQRTYVKYITEAISKNTNVDQRQILDQLLLQEERQLMMAEVDAPYAASVLDGPTVTPVNRVLRTLLIGGFAGLLIGVAIAIGSNHLPRRWRWR
jgi:hypothetical protein